MNQKHKHFPILHMLGSLQRPKDLQRPEDRHGITYSSQKLDAVNLLWTFLKCKVFKFLKLFRLLKFVKYNNEIALSYFAFEMTVSYKC